MAGFEKEHQQVKSPQVTACEIYPAMVQVAQHLIAHNDLSPHIQLLPVRSDEIQMTSQPQQPQQLNDSASASDTSADRQQGQLRHQPAAHASHSRQKRAAKLALAAASEQKQKCMDRRADVIVTEIFDSELLGEGILPTMQHAVKHLLQV